MSVVKLVDKVRDYNPAADVGMIESAYQFSARCHKGQKRMSGEPYLIHPLAVANIIAEMRLDVPSIVTGLLHDTVEDTLATLDEIGGEFGSEVAGLVDGVTKITLLESNTREEAEAQTMRKMFLAGAKDIRVILVKLADRAHNLRTLSHLPAEKRARIAQQTLDIYAPLANRLGIHWLKSEFEDRTFRILRPEQWKEINERLALRSVQRQGYIEEVTNILNKRLLEAGLESEVSGRLKSAYSIFDKMKSQDLHCDEVYDVVAFRVLVDGERDCYDALGVIHKHWRPVPGRFRDYVALPKANMYQSLHTTVIGPYGERMEVQIRSRDMHRVADFGIAAHWRYKSSGDSEGSEDDRFDWLQQLLEWQQHLDNPQQYLHTVKQDLFAEEVVVFTPKGQTRTLPKGATVVDFAYRIHSEVGDRCAAGRVNGQLVSQRHVLEPGDTVEVITTEEQTPSRDWLKFVQTPRARERILAWLKQDEKSRALALGRELVERDLSRYQLDLSRLHREGRMAELLKRFGRASEQDLLEAVGYGRVRTKQLLDHLLPERAEGQIEARSGLRRLFGLLERQKKDAKAVVIRGDDMGMMRFGKCCHPLAGEKIVGFITRGRGITVHSEDCERLTNVDRGRLVEVTWAKGARAPCNVRIEVVSRDRPGLLAHMSQAIASAGVNIDRAYVRTTSDNQAINVFQMTLFNADDLSRVERNLRRVPGVRELRRIRT